MALKLEQMSEPSGELLKPHPLTTLGFSVGLAGDWGSVILADSRVILILSIPQDHTWRTVALFFFPLLFRLGHFTLSSRSRWNLLMCENVTNDSCHTDFCYTFYLVINYLMPVASPELPLFIYIFDVHVFVLSPLLHYVSCVLEGKMLVFLCFFPLTLLPAWCHRRGRDGWMDGQWQ